jgi:hypothetical protein
LAAFGDATGASGSAKNLASEVVAIGRHITGIEELAMQETTDQARRKVLEIYALGKPAAASKPVEGTRRPDPADDDLLEEIYAKEAIWRNRGHPFRLLLSQRQLGMIEPREVAQFGREMSFYYKESIKFPKLKKETNRSFFSAIAVAFLGLLLAIFQSWSANQALAATLRPFVPLIPFVLIMVVAAVRAVMLSQSDNLPYGMRAFDVLALCVLGPFTDPIVDEASPLPPTK